MLGNDRRHWGIVARAFHWITVLLVAAQVPLGFWMNRVYGETLATHGDFTLLLRISRAHHTIGFVVLILATARLAWRSRHPPPDLPAALAAYQRFLAAATHGFLYVLLFVFPLTGWAALSAYAGDFPIFFFGFDAVPRIVPQADGNALLTYEFFAAIHKACWRAGGVILSLHVAGALWHQFVARDGLLGRMWSGSAGTRQPGPDGPGSR